MDLVTIHSWNTKILRTSHRQSGHLLYLLQTHAYTHTNIHRHTNTHRYVWRKDSNYNSPQFSNHFLSNIFSQTIYSWSSFHVTSSHAFTKWLKKAERHGETPQLFSVSGSLPWPGMCLGSVVFEVMLISPEKVSLLVYSNTKTWSFTAAIVIYVQTTDNCARQIHTFWQWAYRADIWELFFFTFLDNLYHLYGQYHTLILGTFIGWTPLYIITRWFFNFLKIFQQTFKCLFT